MRNRIRDYRQKNGLTQGDLATQVGTTAQTISRLEGGNMTLSTDWLVRFANVFHVHPTDLLEQPGQRDISVIGAVDPNGSLAPKDPDPLSLNVPFHDALALKMTSDISHYRSGDILVCEKLPDADKETAVGKDCFVMLSDQTGVLCRVMKDPSSDEARYILSPLTANQNARFSNAIAYMAPIRMRISYF